MILELEIDIKVARTITIIIIQESDDRNTIIHSK